MVKKNPADLPKFFRNDWLSYKLLFSKGKIHMFYLLNFGFSYILYRTLLMKEINTV